MCRIVNVRTLLLDRVPDEISGRALEMAIMCFNERPASPVFRLKTPSAMDIACDSTEASCAGFPRRWRRMSPNIRTPIDGPDWSRTG